MSLPKELLDAVKQDKRMLARKFGELKDKLSEALNLAANNIDTNNNIVEAVDTNNDDIVEAVENLNPEANNIDTNNDDIVEAVENLNNTVKNQDTPEVQATAFDSIIKQGEIAEEELKIQETVKEIQTNLDKSRSSLTREQILATEEQITLLKSGKLDSLESKKEARESAEKTKEALENIAENQGDLLKEFKSGFSELRGEGLGGLIKMLLVGIPALLAGIVAGVGAQITAVLSRFKTFGLIFTKIGGAIAPVLTALKTGAVAVGGFLKTLPMIGTFFANLFRYAGMAFKLGTGLAKLAGPIGIAIAIITAVIGGIKGAFKGFKEDGIIGMFREGIIGVFDGLIGGLVKMIGSMIGGIFKLLGFEKIGEAIKGGFSDFVDGVFGIFRGTFNMLAGIFTLDFGLLKEGIGQVLDGIINGIMGVIKGIGGIILGTILLPFKTVKNVLMFIIDAFKAAFEGIKFVIFDLPGMLIEKVKEFFSNMVEKIGDAFSGAFDFVKKIGAASKAALKAALPGGESPKEAFMRVMGGDSGGGEEKEEKENIENLKKSEETVLSSPQEPIMPKVDVVQSESIKEFETRMKNAIVEIDAAEDAQIQTGSEQFKMESAERIADRPEVGPTTAQPIIDRTEVLPAKAPIGRQRPMSQGLNGFLMRKAANAVLGPDIMGKARGVLNSRNPVEEAKKLFNRTQNRVGGFSDATPLQKLRRFMDASGSSSGANLASSQIENNQLTRQLTGGSPTSVIAPSTVNNSKSSVTNTTIAAPPHIDKTQSLFGMTNLGW